MMLKPTTVGEWLNQGYPFDRACHAVGFFVIVSSITVLIIFAVISVWLGAADLVAGFRR